nr:hypothetical protein B0A51_13011 [Rachicladosporium sp. CCFEE 5018]
MKSPLSKELKNDTSEDLVGVDHTIVAQHVSSESVRLSRQSASSTTSTNLDPSDRTIEAPPARRIVLYELEEGEDPYAIEDELAVRRGFLSAADEIDFMERNLSYGTTGF